MQRKRCPYADAVQYICDEGGRPLYPQYLIRARQQRLFFTFYPHAVSKVSRLAACDALPLEMTVNIADLAIDTFVSDTSRPPNPLSH